MLPSPFHFASDRTAGATCRMRPHKTAASIMPARVSAALPNLPMITVADFVIVTARLRKFSQGAWVRSRPAYPASGTPGFDLK